jgi:hypothetical protein
MHTIKGDVAAGNAAYFIVDNLSHIGGFVVGEKGDNLVLNR